MPRETGFPTRDAQDDFLRARRRRVFAQLSSLLRLESGDARAGSRPVRLASEIRSRAASPPHDARTPA
ncbi:MAG TPA: hypothetical protein VG474_00570, partial [Solirubrobacteraceae bacterium]|nr:hypothetical protein [Solirubrobacteraceae bacterium]